MRIRTITSKYKKKHEHLELYPDRQLVVDEIIACLIERKLWLQGKYQISFTAFVSSGRMAMQEPVNGILNLGSNVRENQWEGFR